MQAPALAQVVLVREGRAQRVVVVLPLQAEIVLLTEIITVAEEVRIQAAVGEPVVQVRAQFRILSERGVAVTLGVVVGELHEQPGKPAVVERRGKIGGGNTGELTRAARGHGAVRFKRLAHHVIFRAVENRIVGRKRHAVRRG
jgi:hypothetical protein